MNLAFPKPKHIKRVAVAVRVYSDGREVCMENAHGRQEYRNRRYIAWAKQKHLCAICHVPILFADAVTDHIEPRGMGGARRDDRQEKIQATCWKCNLEKGSKR